MSDAGGRIDRHTDFLISIGLVLDDKADFDFERLRQLVDSLESSFQFWELLLAVPWESDGIRAEHSRLTSPLPNTRILYIGNDSSFYRLRLACAAEAIGDVVVLTSLAELPSIDIHALGVRAYESENVVFATRSVRAGLSTPLLPILGYISGYRINRFDTLTAVFPLSVLSLVLGRPDAELLLRFESRSRLYPVERVAIESHVERPKRRFVRRFRLLSDLISQSSTRILTGLAVLSFLTSAVSALYAVYAILVWLILENPAEGWLTTSLAQAGIAGFLGIAVAAISMAIVKIFDRLEGVMSYAIISEEGSTDFLGGVTDLNVEIGLDDLDPGSPEESIDGPGQV